MSDYAPSELSKDASLSQEMVASSFGALAVAEPTSHAPLSWHIQMNGVNTFWTECDALCASVWTAFANIAQRYKIHISFNEWINASTERDSLGQKVRLEIAACKKKFDADIPPNWLRLLNYLEAHEESDAEQAYLEHTQKNRYNAARRILHKVMTKHCQRGKLLDALFRNENPEGICEDLMAPFVAAPYRNKCESDEDFRAQQQKICDRRRESIRLGAPTYPLPIKTKQLPAIKMSMHTPISFGAPMPKGDPVDIHSSVNIDHIKALPGARGIADSIRVATIAEQLDDLP